jgi:hypothetical protein
MLNSYQEYLTTLPPIVPGFYCVLYHETSHKKIDECLSKSNYLAYAYKLPCRLTNDKQGNVKTVLFETIKVKYDHGKLKKGKQLKKNSVPANLYVSYPYELEVPKGLTSYRGCEKDHIRVMWLNDIRDLKQECLVNFDIDNVPNPESVPFAVRTGNFYPM